MAENEAHSRGSVVPVKSARSFCRLKDAWADTTPPHGRLMLTVLGGLADFERDLIRARTGEGRKRAQERGVKFGRMPKLEKIDWQSPGAPME
jgi:DNA invertase Pin-like site-specific DNA recombinase